MRKAKFATVSENTAFWLWNGYREGRPNKIDIDIEIDDISQKSIEIDRKFLGAYRPITNWKIHVKYQWRNYRLSHPRNAGAAAGGTEVTNQTF